MRSSARSATLPALHWVVPGPLDQRTGGYLYDRRIVDGLRARDHELVVHELEGRFPVTDAAARAAGEQALAALATGLPVIDGLALPAFAGQGAALPEPWVALVHHPLALETGLSEAEAAALRAIELDLLPRAARVIVTSRQTARDLAGHGIAADRIGVVEPGTERAPLAQGSGQPAPTLLCVASLTPRKGHLVLLDALAHLRDLDWRLVCVGSGPDRATQDEIRAAIARHRLRARVALLGEKSGPELDAAYGAADLFVLASYHEGYGMALAEALARGLPIVATQAGAIPDTVPPAAGLLVPPGDAHSLAAALRMVIGDRQVRAHLAEGARAVRLQLPTWHEAAAAFTTELGQLAYL